MSFNSNEPSASSGSIDLRQLFLRHVAQTSPDPLGIEISRAEGIYLYEPSGKRYMDLIGGISDVISRSPIRKTAYDCVSCLNARHMRFAWFSLVWVGFSDLYVRMCAMGVWTDWRIF